MPDLKISALPDAGAITGDEWTVVVQGGVDKRARTKAFLPEVNVLKFNADPTGVLDSSEAINNAVALGSPYFPAGTYKINAASIDLLANRRYRGAGEFDTRIVLANSANKKMFDLAIGGQSNIEICDMTIDGNRANQSGSTLYGVSLVTCDVAKVRRVYFTETYNRAINVYQGSRISVEDCDFTDIGQAGSDPEDFAVYASGTTDFTFARGQMEDLAGAGVITPGCDGVDIHHSTVRTCGYIAFGFGDGTTAGAISYCKAWDCTDNAYDTGNSVSCSVTHSYADGALGGVVADLTAYGASVDADLTVKSNELRNIVQSAVLILGPTTGTRIARGVRVDDNEAYECGEHGFLLSRVWYGSLSRNLARNVGTSTTTLGQWSMFRLARDSGGCQQIQVHDNIGYETRMVIRNVGIDRGDGGAAATQNKNNSYRGNMTLSCYLPIGGTIGDGDSEMYADGSGAVHVTGALVADEIVSNGDVAALRYVNGANGATFIEWNSGDPNGVITASPGAVVLDTDGSGAVIWEKDSGAGNTGWVNNSTS